MTRVVYNNCYGGFGVTEATVKWVRENRDRLTDEYGEDAVEDIASCPCQGEYYSDGSGPKKWRRPVSDIERDNELLADLVEHKTDFDDRVDGEYASLKVTTVPDGIEWELDYHDGAETVREVARTFS